ncbi:MAG: hypothetical protein ACD_3C00179G0007 [uncultured bacterium (gcode 4)]|uniref:ABC transporter domain-containing protein n=1 Tax=uncultured bacterium (gcode 4) TaxID=1234023 RepID=K2GBW2_9BACT|nr:MAG: hypothetical protein ACD_3C00179G0007 [uncultured bacterium (gcode 4)]
MYKNLEYLLVFAKKFKLYWFLLLTVTVFSSAIQVAIPYLAKLEIDQLANRHDYLSFIKNSPFNIFLFIVLIVLLTNFLNQILSVISSALKDYYWKKLEMSFKNDLYRRMRNIKPWFFLNKRNSYFFQEFRDLGNILDRAMSFVIDCLRSILESVWIFLVFSFIDYKIWLALIAIGLITWFTERKRRILQEQMDMDDKFEIIRKLWKSENELIANRHLLQISGWIEFVENYIKNVFEESFSKKLIYLKNDIKYNFITVFSNHLLTTFIKVVVWYSVFYYSSSIGLMSMTIMYVWNINSIVYRFMQMYLSSYLSLKTSLQKIWIIFSLTSKNDKAIKGIWKIEKIKIENLEFRYPSVSQEELQIYDVMNEKLKKMWDSKKEWIQRDIHFINEAIAESKKPNPYILKWVNALFEKWKIYWIVWRNWVWKTTLINLIMWFFDEFEWWLTYSDIDIKTIENGFFDSHISYVSQSPYLMENFSIKENLLLWVKKELNDNEIYSYLDKFSMEKKIRSLRKWLDSEIWFESEFSGWQRQLLALIRAILQDKQIIIFDEWTNQLDAENELLVMKELLKNKKDKIIIFITHRMTTIKKADLIYCIDDWKISDSWTHNELLERENVYKSFWENQVEKGFE